MIFPNKNFPRGDQNAMSQMRYMISQKPVEQFYIKSYIKVSSKSIGALFEILRYFLYLDNNQQFSPCFEIDIDNT